MFARSAEGASFVRVSSTRVSYVQSLARNPGTYQFLENDLMFANSSEGVSRLANFFFDRVSRFRVLPRESRNLRIFSIKRVSCLRVLLRKSHNISF